MPTLLLLALASLQNSLPSHAASAPSSQVEWSRTVESASKEVQVNIYMYATWGNAIQNANVFQKAFPNIRLSVVTGMDLDSREEWMQRDGYVNLVKSTMAKKPKE
jgi:hypothetical protein